MVVAGRAVPIAQVRLERGQVVVESKPVPGPIDADPEAVITIFGADGTGIVQGRPFPMSGMDAGKTAVFCYEMSLEAVR